MRRLTDYQDAAYADLFRQRLDRLHLEGVLLAETARHLALWMSYEDTIRVADLKTRASRFARVRREVRVKPGQMLRITEFMHPRVQEIADTLPAPLGRWLLRSGLPRRALERLTARGTACGNDLDRRVPAAAGYRVAAAVPARHAALQSRNRRGSRLGWRASARLRRATRRSHCRSRGASGW